MHTAEKCALSNIIKVSRRFFWSPQEHFQHIQQERGPFPPEAFAQQSARRRGLRRRYRRRLQDERDQQQVIHIRQGVTDHLQVS